ncbi:MAG: VPLPA-CTERM sorting domain-containing protein [Nitrospira sp.]|jgi:hypothetical protein|nr:VPLPA-CTERM sorting domain-containing protein [Nitrospira sp.]
MMTKTIRKPVMTMVGLGAGLLCALLMAPDRSQAASISFNFSGSVGDVYGRVFTPQGFGHDGFTTALPVSADASFNTLATDTRPASNLGLYNNPIQDFSVSVGTYFAAFAPGSSSISITNRAPGAGNDVYKLTVNGLFGDHVNGYSPSQFLLELTDPSGTAFSSDKLQGPPSLSSFARSEFRLLFGGVGTRVQGALTSLVPLPAAVWLFGAGLIALVGLGSRGLVARKES